MKACFQQLEAAEERRAADDLHIANMQREQRRRAAGSVSPNTASSLLGGQLLGSAALAQHPLGGGLREQQALGSIALPPPYWSGGGLGEQLLGSAALAQHPLGSIALPPPYWSGGGLGEHLLGSTELLPYWSGGRLGGTVPLLDGAGILAGLGSLGGRAILPPMPGSALDWQQPAGSIGVPALGGFGGGQQQLGGEAAGKHAAWRMKRRGSCSLERARRGRRSLGRARRGRGRGWQSAAAGWAPPKCASFTRNLLRAPPRACLGAACASDWSREQVVAN
jgi:hypothetical protein